MDGDWQDAIERARAHAPFLALRAATASPSWPTLLERGEGEAALALARAAGEGAADVAVGAAPRAAGAGDRAGDRRPRGRLPARAGHGRAQPPSPTARSMRAIADAIRRRVPDAEPAGFIAHRARQARRGRAQLQLRHRPDPALRSRRACRGASATSRPRRRSAMRATMVETLVAADRRGLRVPRRPAAAPGLRGQPAGDLVRRRAQPLRKLGAGVGARGLHPRPRRRRRRRRGRASSSPRSARSSGAAASISPRSRRSAG